MGTAEKFIVGVLIFLGIFVIYKSCSGEDDKPDYDKIQAQKRRDRQLDYDFKKSAEQRKIQLAEREKAKKALGDKRPPEKSATLETSDFKAIFTSRGGTLKSLTLKDPQFLEAPMNWETGERDTEAEEYVPVNLVTTKSDQYERNNLFRLVMNEGLEALLPDTDWTIEKQSESEVVFRYEQPFLPIVVLKKFELVTKSPLPYQLWCTIQITNKGKEKIAFVPGVTLTGYQKEVDDGGIFSFLKGQPNIQQGICNVGDDEVAQFAWQSDDLPYSSAAGSTVSYAGIHSNYFISAMIPTDDIPTTCHVYRSKAHSYKTRQPVISSELRYGKVSLAPGEKQVFKIKGYFGPKRYQQLEKTGHNLKSSVDFGWFTPICQFLLWLLFAIQKVFVNWGVAIIMLTVLIKLVLMPLTHKSFQSSERMKSLQPQVEKVKEKHKDNPQEQQKAIMALYKTNKVNPLGGCLPMLLQMPIWIALYRTLRGSPELYRTEFFGWITDLSAPDPYYITPVVMGAMMFVQQLFMPMTGDNAQAKMMKYFMPIMFTAMMLMLPSGLTLYILVNTVLSIIHQAVIHKLRTRKEAA